MVVAARQANVVLFNDFSDQPEESGLADISRKQKIIVSFTTYPARIGKAYLVADRMLKQTVKPDLVVLYLAESQFLDRKLPVQYEVLQRRGLKICWCPDDLMAHKKYYYAMQDYPDDIVITVDDDVTYPTTLVETLYDSYKHLPDAIHATRAHRITLDNTQIATYSHWVKDIIDDRPCSGQQFLATGIGGVLYPPHLLPMETYNTQLIRSLALQADDMWLKAMEVLNDVPVALTKNHFPCYEIAGTQKTALVYDNVGRGLNNDILKNILAHYHLENKLVKHLK
jgi:hypothetical protein